MSWFKTFYRTAIHRLTQTAVFRQISQWFSPTITSGVWRLWGIAVVALIVFMVGLLWELQRINNNSAAFANTEAIEGYLRGLGEDLLDAETGQRGYLLTRDEEYLLPYRAGIASAQSRIEALRSLVVDPTGRATR